MSVHDNTWDSYDDSKLDENVSQQTIGADPQEQHPAFTDFLFILCDNTDKVLGFIEVKNITIATLLHEALRKAQIVLLRGGAATVPLTAEVGQ